MKYLQVYISAEDKEQADTILNSLLDKNNLPFDKMWGDNKDLLPKVLNGENFHLASNSSMRKSSSTSEIFLKDL